MRILVCEDEALLSKSICTYLSQKNFVTDCAVDGKAALSYIRTNVYDLVVLDIMMPFLDGFSVLKTIREEGISVPVLILSAKSEIEDKVAGLDLGANDYLTKPFDMRELLARINALLRKGNSQNSTRIVMGNTILDTEKCTLSTPFGSFALVKKEYLMLSLFMRNEGLVITPETLIDKVWNFEKDAEISTVWTYVSYLRKKLKALKSDVSIKTKRNLGYVLVNKND